MFAKCQAHLLETRFSGHPHCDTSRARSGANRQLRAIPSGRPNLATPPHPPILHFFCHSWRPWGTEHQTCVEDMFEGLWFDMFAPCIPHKTHACGVQSGACPTHRHALDFHEQRAGSEAGGNNSGKHSSPCPFTKHLCGRCRNMKHEIRKALVTPRFEKKHFPPKKTVNGWNFCRLISFEKILWKK